MDEVAQLARILAEVKEKLSYEPRPIKATTIVAYTYCPRQAFLEHLLENSLRLLGVDAYSLLRMPEDAARRLVEGALLHGAMYGCYVDFIPEPRSAAEALRAALNGEVLPRWWKDAFQVQGAADAINVTSDGLEVVEIKTTRSKDFQPVIDRALFQASIYAWIYEYYGLRVARLVALVYDKRRDRVEVASKPYDRRETEEAISRILRDLLLGRCEPRNDKGCDACRLRELCKRYSY